MIPVKNRMIFHCVFFKSIIGSSFAVGILLALLSLLSSYPSSPATIVQWISFFLSYIPYGLLLILFYKEMAHKEQYYFYYNQGITKIELWVVSFILSVSIQIIFNLICILCRFVWKLIA